MRGAEKHDLNRIIVGYGLGTIFAHKSIKWPLKVLTVSLLKTTSPWLLSHFYTMTTSKNLYDQDTS